MGAAGRGFPAGAQHSSSAHVVGGLLSKQPDWLQGSSSTAAAGPAGPAAAGALPPLHASTALGPPAGKASSLPPLLGRGMPAAAAAAATNPASGSSGGGATTTSSSSSSSLPALFPGGGARAAAPLNEPQQPEEPKHKQDAPHAGAPASREAGHAEGAVPHKTAQLAPERRPSYDQESSDCCSPAAASGDSPAAGAQHQEPADPWSTLQSQYAGGQRSID
jgi:hypothetical protein